MGERIGLTSDQKNQPAGADSSAAADQSRSILNEAVHSVIGTVWHSNSSTRNNVENYACELLTAVPLFMSGGKAYAASAALYGLNQAQTNESFTNQLEDGALGMAKGVAMKGAFDLVGGKNLSRTPLGLAAQGMTLGTLSRAADIGLTRQTYLDANGNVSLNSVLGGAEKTVTSALAPTSLATDAVTFGIAGTALKGLDKVTGGALESSPLLRTMSMGGTFGLTSGALGEVQQERSQHQALDPLKILEKGAIQGGITSIAAIPGGLQAARAAGTVRIGTDTAPAAAADPGRAPKTFSQTLSERVAGLRSMLHTPDVGLTLGSGDSVGPDGEMHRAPVTGGEGDATAKSATAGTPGSDGAHEPAATAGGAGAGDTVNVDITHPVGREADVQAGADLLTNALSSGATDADVQKFYDYARAQGDGLQPAMKQIADRFGTQEAQRMVETAYAPDQEIHVPDGQGQNFQTGLDLMRKIASDPSNAENVQNFQQFVLSPEGAQVGDALTTAAKMMNNPQLADMVERAYAPAREINIDGTPEEQTLAMQGYKLFEAALSPDYTQADVDRLTEWARGDGRTVEPQMLQIAKEVAGDAGYNFMREQIYHGDQARISVDGTDQAIFVDPDREMDTRKMINLATMSIDPTSPSWYSDYLYNAVRNSDPDMQRALLEYGELSGNERLLSDIRDAAAKRPDYDFDLPTTDALNRFSGLVDAINARPAPTPEGVAMYKANITDWLQNNPDLHEAAMDLGTKVENSMAVSAMDDYFGTHNLDAFPTSRSLEGTAARPRDTGTPGALDAVAPSGLRYNEMPIDELVSNLRNSDYTQQKNAGVIGLWRTGEMTDPQFGRYLNWLYDTAPSGRLNLQEIGMPSQGAMLDPAVRQAISGAADGTGFDAQAMRQYFAMQSPTLPEWLAPHVEMQSQIPGAKAMPNWLINDVRARFVLSPDRGLTESPDAAQVSATMRSIIDQDTEAMKAKAAEPKPQGSRGGRIRLPQATNPDTIDDRLTGLKTLAGLQDPPLANRLMELGSQDGRLMNDITRKIDTYGSVPEYRELLSLTLPHADNIYDVNILLRSIEDASKQSFNRGPDAVASGRLAQAAADHMLPPGSPDAPRVAQIIDDFVHGNTKLPRTFRGKEGDAGNNGRMPPKLPPAPLGWYSEATGITHAMEPPVEPGDSAASTTVNPVPVPNAGDSRGLASAAGTAPVAGGGDAAGGHEQVAVQPVGAGETVTAGTDGANEQAVVPPAVPGGNAGGNGAGGTQGGLERTAATDGQEPGPVLGDGAGRVQGALEPTTAAAAGAVTGDGAGGAQGALERTGANDAREPAAVAGDAAGSAQGALERTGANDGREPGVLAGDGAGVAAAGDLAGGAKPSATTDGASTAGVADAGELHQFNDDEAKILDAVNRGKGRNLEKETHLNKRIIQYYVKELKRQGWLAQGSRERNTADTVEVTPQYMDWMKERARLRKQGDQTSN